MYAIVEIGGQQLKVEEKAKIYVNLIDAVEGTKVEFDRVLLVDNEGAVKIGQPVVEGAKISATVLAHVKGEKELVFKKKRRKTYQVMNGHRQQYTQIEIGKITA
jgi:large subunit ribosomal protein L21